MKIYHNPRCSKSRQTLQIIQDKNIDIDIILYLKNPPSVEELKFVLTKLGITPMELIRTSKVIWKEKFKGKFLSDDQLVSISMF